MITDRQLLICAVVLPFHLVCACMYKHTRLLVAHALCSEHVTFASSAACCPVDSGRFLCYLWVPRAGSVTVQLLFHKKAFAMRARLA